MASKLLPCGNPEAEYLARGPHWVTVFIHSASRYQHRCHCWPSHSDSFFTEWTHILGGVGPPWQTAQKEAYLYMKIVWILHYWQAGCTTKKRRSERLTQDSRGKWPDWTQKNRWGCAKACTQKMWKHFLPSEHLIFFYSETDALIPSFVLLSIGGPLATIKWGKKNSCDIRERLRDVHKKNEWKMPAEKKLYFKFQSGADHLKLYDNLTSWSGNWIQFFFV